MSTELNRDLNFENFVVGPSNEVAATAGRTVAESLGSIYNPLLIYGDVGLGKSHLLIAIGNLAKELTPEIAIEYITPEAFAEAHHAAVAAGQADAFRRRFEDVDLMLVDDVQTLVDRTEVIDEFLRLCSQFQTAGKQVVIVNDCPPEEIFALDARLESLEGGLSVDIGTPDDATRLEIVRRRAVGRGADLSESVLKTIADFETGNVRRLLGYLNRVLAFQIASEQSMNVRLAREVMEGQAALRSALSPKRGSQGDLGAQNEFADFFSGISGAVAEQVATWDEVGAERVQSMVGNGVPSAIVPSELGSLPGPSTKAGFEDLVLSESNEEAVSAIREAFGAAGRMHNPLVVTGGPGLGKTRLLHAFGNELIRTGAAVVACISAHEFVDDASDASASGDGDQWLLRYMSVDALLIDDFHLAARTSVATLILRLFHILVNQDKQLGLTINAESVRVEGMDASLTAFLESGKVVSLRAPDRQFRENLVRLLLNEGNVEEDAELVSYLADRKPESVRRVCSVVQRVLKVALERETNPSPTLAREVLDGVGAQPLRRPRPTRASGVILSPAGGLRSPEKVVWQWPNVLDHLIESLG